MSDTDRYHLNAADRTPAETATQTIIVTGRFHSLESLPASVESEAARLARAYPLAEQATQLARWVGRPGRPVTAGRGGRHRSSGCRPSDFGGA